MLRFLPYLVCVKLVEPRNTDSLDLIVPKQLLLPTQALLHELQAALVERRQIVLGLNGEDGVEVPLRSQHEAEVSGSHGHDVWAVRIGGGIHLDRRRCSILLLLLHLVGGVLTGIH